MRWRSKVEKDTYAEHQFPREGNRLHEAVGEIYRVVLDHAADTAQRIDYVDSLFSTRRKSENPQ